MSGSLKLWVYIFGTLLALFLVVKAVYFVMHLLGILVPILAVIGVGVIIFSVVNRKGLGSGRRRILP